jgi:hypothetical protein
MRPFSWILKAQNKALRATWKLMQMPLLLWNMSTYSNFSINHGKCKVFFWWLSMFLSYQDPVKEIHTHVFHLAYICGGEKENHQFITGES